MGLLAEYRLVYDALPLVDVARTVPAATLHVEVGQPNQGTLPPFVLDATAESFAALERALDDSAFVAEWTPMAGDAERRRYRLLPTAGMTDQLAVEDPERLRALAAAESVVEEISVTRQGWHQERWFADRETFLEYWSFWRETADAVSLERLVRVDGEGPSRGRSGDDGLTDPQREALVTARELGYFDVPRGASLSDVADELGVSPAACSERLRRGQATLVADVERPRGAALGRAFPE